MSRGFAPHFLACREGQADEVTGICQQDVLAIGSERERMDRHYAWWQPEGGLVAASNNVGKTKRIRWRKTSLSKGRYLLKLAGRNQACLG